MAEPDPNPQGGVPPAAADATAAVAPAVAAGSGEPAPQPSPPAEAAAAVPVATEAAPDVRAAQPSMLEQFDAEKAKTEAKPAEPAKTDAPPAKPATEEKPSETKAEEKPAEVKEGDKPAEKPAEAKPVEGEKPAEAKPDEAKPAEPATLEPVEYKYTLPETLKLDDASKTEVHAAFDAFRANPAEGAQGLLNLHEKAMQQYAKQLEDNQYGTFNTTRETWRKEVMADEKIGGAGHMTAMTAIARMRDMAVPEADRASFNQFLTVTGAGDHPAFLKMMHNFARFFDEPAQPPPDPKPTANGGARPGRSRAAAIYDHPTSRS